MGPEKPGSASFSLLQESLISIFTFICKVYCYFYKLPATERKIDNR